MDSTRRRSRGYLSLLGILIFIAPALLFAQTKEEIWSQLVSLGAQFETLRSQGVPASVLDSHLEQYRSLSAQLGGDDPAGLLGDRQGTSHGGVRAAPAAPPGGVATTSSFTNSTPTAIPDGPGGVATRDVVVSGVDPYLWDLDMTLDLTHTFAADLDITLTSPGGTTTTITTDNGGGNDNVFAGTLFDDFAPDTVTDFVYTNLVVATPLIPEGAMAAFVGEDPNGTWTLTVTDDAGLDLGTVNSLTLDVTTLPSAPLTASGSAANSTVTPIPDGPGGLVSSDIVVSGLDTFLCSVTMTTDITHTFAADLEITLTSPGATTTTISTDNGAGNDDVFAGTLWSDAAADTATDYVYANLVVAPALVPEGAMGAFIGEDPNGTWTLSITDDAGLDVGDINSWSLDLTTCSPLIAPTPIPTLSATGIVLLVLLLAGAALLVLRGL